MADENKDTGLSLVLSRNYFYRDQYRRAIVILLLVILIDVILAAGVVYRYINPPQPQYFAANDEFQFMKWYPLSAPVVSNIELKQWVADSITAAFSLDYVHWQKQLQDASVNFTPVGWRLFLAALKQSNNLNSLTQLQMVSSLELVGSPTITNHGRVNGIYVWEVQLPIVVKFTNGKTTIPWPAKVAVIVERVPVQSNPKGIAISNFLPEVQSE